MPDDVPSPQVGLAELARLAGVGAAAVSNWRRRHPSFPQPVGGTDRSPRFALADVETWLAAQGRALNLAPEERAWLALDAARGAAAPVDLLLAAGLALGHSAPSERSRRRPEQGQADRHNAIATTVATVAEALRTADNPADAFDALCLRVLDSANRPGFSLTDPELAEAILTLAGPARGAVFDPACGAGSLLIAGGLRGYKPVLGQEVEPELARVAVARLAARGLRPDVSVGDSLLKPRALPVRPGAVVCHPPFAERSWGQEALADDPRFAYGLPPKGESELAWVQLALSCIEADGSAVVVMPPAAASRPSGRRLRRELVAAGALAAVVALPPGLAAHYSLALQLWVLHKPSDRASTGHIVVADTGEPDADWARVHEVVTTVVTALYPGPSAGDEPALEPDAVVVRLVPVAEVLDDDAVDLTPRRYLAGHIPATPSAPVLTRRCDDVSGRWTALARQLQELGAAVKAAGSATEDAEAAQRHSPVRELTLEELERSGLLVIRRRPSRSGEPASKTSATILTAVDLALRRPPSETGDVDADELRNPPIRPGDVLVPAVATQVRARVAEPSDVGSYPGPGVTVLRPDPSVVDPHFLAGHLSSTRASRQADRVGTSHGSALRVDPRRLRIPVPPVEVQRRWGTLFRHVAEAERLIGETVAATDPVLADVRDAAATWSARGTPEHSHDVR